MDIQAASVVLHTVVLAALLATAWPVQAHELELTEQDHGEVVVEPHKTHASPEGSDHSEHLIAGGLITVAFLGLLVHDRLQRKL